MKNKKTVRVRFLVMLAVLAIAAIGYFTSFGIGNICGIGEGFVTLLCPLGAILAMISERCAIPLAVVSVVAVLVVCVVLGKVFCSWVCPVHFLSKLKPEKKGKKSASADAQNERPASCATCSSCASPCGKKKGIKLDSRHGILAAALLSTGIFGFPVFCLICPVGLTFALVMLVMRLFAFGEATWTIVAFAAIILIEVIFLPRWCKHFCPLGALMSLFSSLNRTFRPHVDETKCLNRQGVECNRCVNACPEGINLHDIAAGSTTINDCSKCKACSDVCPAHAISFPLISKDSPAEKAHAAKTADSSAPKE